MFGLDPLPRTLDAALRDAHDPKTWVRVSAVHDLARHGDSPDKRRIAATLVQVLRGDTSAEARGAAAIALADVSAEGVTAALLHALRDEAVHVRQMALLALGEIGETADPGVRGAVESALTDAAAPLRFQALIANGRLFPDSAEPSLVAALEDADREVRHLALRLLEERGTDRGAFSEAVLAAANEALSDAHISVRAAAAILLSRAGDPAGDRVLAEICAYRGKGLDAEDEQAAIELAGERRLESARPGLASRAFGSFGFKRSASAYAARVALAKIGDLRARQSIVRGLSAWSRDERTLAVVAAGQARLTAARDAVLALRGRPDRAEPEAVEEALAAIDGQDVVQAAKDAGTP